MRWEEGHRESRGRGGPAALAWRLPWGRGHSPLRAQASFLRVHGCVGFPRFDRGAAGTLPLCGLTLGEGLRGATAGGGRQGSREGAAGPQRPRRPSAQLCASGVMSTLGHREWLSAPQRALVKVGIWGPAQEPDSLEQVLTPPLGDLAIPGSQCEPAVLPFPRSPSVTWGHRNCDLPRNRVSLEMVPVVILVIPAGVSASPADSGGPWHQVRLLRGQGSRLWPAELSCWSLLGARVHCWDTQRTSGECCAGLGPGPVS